MTTGAGGWAPERSIDHSGHPSPRGGLAQNLPSPVPDTGGGQSQAWVLPWSLQAGGGDSKVNLSVGSNGREHRWLMSEAASVPRLWPDPVLGALGVSIPFPSGALPALPASPPPGSLL